MDIRVFCAGATRASEYAAEYLRKLGIRICTTESDHPDYLLLDVPSFQAGGKLRGGGDLFSLLSRFSGNIVICGGNLNHPALSEYATIDFLKDPQYLAENAYITAECALDVTLPYIGRTLRGCPVLIIGWGRIGKCLGTLLKTIGADVTIAARKEADRAMIRALGYHSLDTTELREELSHYRIIYNTAPELVLDAEKMAFCRADCVKIELASSPGMEGEDIITARGLPGIHMPESSGELIAKTFLRLAGGSV